MENAKKRRRFVNKSTPLRCSLSTTEQIVISVTNQRTAYRTLVEIETCRPIFSTSRPREVQSTIAELASLDVLGYEAAELAVGLSRLKGFHFRIVSRKNDKRRDFQPDLRVAESIDTTSLVQRAMNKRRRTFQKLKSAVKHVSLLANKHAVTHLVG